MPYFVGSALPVNPKVVERNTFLEFASEQPVACLRKSRSFPGCFPSWKEQSPAMNPKCISETSRNGSSRTGLQLDSETDSQEPEIEPGACALDEPHCRPDTGDESSDFVSESWQCNATKMSDHHCILESCAAKFLHSVKCKFTVATADYQVRDAAPSLPSNVTQPQQSLHQHSARPLCLNDCLVTEQAITGSAPGPVPASDQACTTPFLPMLVQPVWFVLPSDLVPQMPTVTSPTDEAEVQEKAATLHDMEQKQIRTLMVRNVPTRITQQRFLNDLDRSGFRGLYDFCYLPRDFNKTENKGFAFVNFSSTATAVQFVRSWHNQRRLGVEDWEPSLNISPATLQGFEANKQKWTSGRYQRVRNPDLRPFLRFQVPEAERSR